MARGSNKAIGSRSRTGKPGAARQHQLVDDLAAQRNSASVPLVLQQKCLDIFRNVLKISDEDNRILQEVKGHLYNRDFVTAFGREEYLRVYASRWSPSRALAYTQIFADFQDELFGPHMLEPLHVTCVGGGAGAELVALAGWQSMQQQSQSDTHQARTIEASFIDSAAWNVIIEELYRATITPPELSKHASSAAREANVALLAPETYTATAEQTDVLSMSEEQSQARLENSHLVTIMFTLNELYTTSMPKTQQMLAHFTRSLQPGARLLVVDSPGSYSTVSINGTEKRYPMQWLLDYTLIGASTRSGDAPKWEKLVSDESRWFRLPQGLTYPIELENMRYQIHLFRRLPDAVEDG